MSFGVLDNVVLEESLTPVPDHESTGRTGPEVEGDEALLLPNPASRRFTSAS